MQGYFYYIIILTFLLMASCSPDEGTGGTSSISGKITVEEVLVNIDNCEVLATYSAQEHDVYLIYGDNINEFYDEDVKTSWNGNFEFNFLKKGKYIVYTYSDCIGAPCDCTDAACDSCTLSLPKQYISRSIEINENSQEVPDVHFTVKENF